MTGPRASLAFVALLVAAAGFVLLSGRSLPPVVASHFNANGDADGFMPRTLYLGLMVAIAIGLPLLVASLHSVVRFVPARFINLPNRDYWLAPARITETLAYLQVQGRRFAVIMAAFLCYVHWLVVQANTVQPPHLSGAMFAVGMLLFLAALAIWLGAYLTHFRRR